MTDVAGADSAAGQVVAGGELAQLAAALESFFAEGMHLTLQRFVADNKAKFVALQPGGTEEQSHSNFVLFQQFSVLVESELASFLEQRGLSTDKLWQVVKAAHEGGEADLAPHLNYLLASTEYLQFVQLFADYSGFAPGGGDEAETTEADGDIPEWA